MQIFLARACILLNFDTFFPISVAISPLSFSKLLRYHLVTTSLPSSTFPVLSCYFVYFLLILLRKSKKCSNFATANPKFADILLKAFISACFRDSKSCKISSYLKQEGSKRPLGYDYPAHRASFIGLLCLVAFIFGVGVRCLFL